MLNLKRLNEVLDNLVVISKKAGEEILEVYSDTFSVTLKDDLSPLTDADKRSNTVITSNLQSLYPEIPILSEEGRQVKYSTRKMWDILQYY